MKSKSNNTTYIHTHTHTVLLCTQALHVSYWLKPAAQQCIIMSAPGEWCHFSGDQSHPCKPSCGWSHSPQINHTSLWAALYLRCSRGQMNDCWCPSDLVFGSLKGVLGRWKVTRLLGSRVREKTSTSIPAERIMRGFQILAVCENKK